MTDTPTASDSIGSLCERLRGLLAKATPGPWEHMQGRGMVRAIRGDVAVPLLETRTPWRDPVVEAPTVRVAGEVIFRAKSQGAHDSEALKREWGNAELIAVAINALPILLDALEAPKASTLDADRERITRLMTALAKVMPIRVNDGADYAEAYFSDGIAHSTQAMTMNPQDWREIDAAYMVLLASPNASRGVPVGMIAWGGGDQAPADWDGGATLLRDGTYGDGEDWRHLVGIDDTDSPNDIIAYTAKQDLIDRAELRRKLDQLIAAASREWGVGSQEHNLVRDISDAVTRAPSAQPNASNGVSEGWKTIETAPDVKGKYFFCQIAWGPEWDKCTGSGFRWNGRWFAAAIFYNNASAGECQHEFRQIEVEPTHWRPLPPSPLMGAPIRKGMCHGCPYDYGAEGTEMAYNYGCLPSAGEATSLAVNERQAWACHEEPDKVCCGFAANNKTAASWPLYRDGHHGERFEVSS